MAQTLTQPINSLPDVSPEAQPSPAESDAVNRTRSWAQDLVRARLQARQALGKNVGSEIRQQVVRSAQRYTARIALRIINFGSAATLVGVIVTFLIMNMQLFFFNVILANTDIGKALKLEWWEVGIIVLLDFIIIFLLIISIMMAVGLNPGFWISLLADVIWTSFKQGACRIIPASCEILGV